MIKGEQGEFKVNEGVYDDTSSIYGSYKNKTTTTYTDKGDTHTNPNCPCRLLDEQSGVSKSSKGLMKSAQSGNEEGRYNWNNGDENDFESVRGHNDSGGASRFFYQAKVGKKERNMGLENFEEKENNSIGSTYAGNQTTSKIGGNPDKPTEPKKNSHPTVKPVSLMTYLVRLVTPKGGTVLDPYMGSGSTGISTLLEGFNFVGMEMDEEYFKIASERINNYENYRQFIKK